MALSGFIVQLDRSIGPLSSVLEASEVKAGNDAVDELNKALFLPSLNTSRRDDADDGLRKKRIRNRGNFNILFYNRRKKRWITEGKKW